jgi:type IV pilus assembly protein PilC
LVLVRAVGRGMFWTKPIQRAVLRVPMLGGVVQTLALARLAWSLHLTMKVGMEVRRALRLSLRSTHNSLYTDQIEAIDAQIMGGSSIHEAFLQEATYPADFLDTLAVGEQSGKIVESMGRLSLQYQERARAALVTLNLLAGVAVWCVIAAVIIALIFQLFTKLYLGPINELLQP